MKKCSKWIIGGLLALVSVTSCAQPAPVTTDTIAPKDSTVVIEWKIFGRRCGLL